jgi:hypothetical protein
MKKFKVFSASVSFFLFLTFIYFSAAGFSADTDAKLATAQEIKKINDSKPSSTVMLYIILTDSGGNHCLNGSYTYCINGGIAMSASGEGFYIEVPCGEEITICVQSELCSGWWTGVPACNTDTFKIIDMSPDNHACNCK